MCALVVNIFDPEMVQPSPVRTAVVAAAAASEPFSGLGEPQHDDDLGGERLRQDLALLRLGADLRDDPGDHHRRAERVRRSVGALHLLGEGQHLHRVAALAAVLDGPAERKPALVAHRLGEAVVVLDTGAVAALEDLGRQHLAEELLRLLAQDLALLAQPEVHQTSCRSATRR